MTSKIVEVLTVILEGLSKKNSLEEMNLILNDKKEYDDPTISAAFSLIYDKMLNRKSKKRNIKARNFRLLNIEEKERIGLDNYNYIMHLFNVGLLSAIDFELFIEQLMLFPEDRLTKEDINWSILVSLVDFNAEILPGSRILLYSSDTVN